MRGGRETIRSTDEGTVSPGNEIFQCHSFGHFSLHAKSHPRRPRASRAASSWCIALREFSSSASCCTTCALSSFNAAASADTSRSSRTAWQKQQQQQQARAVSALGLLTSMGQAGRHECKRGLRQHGPTDCTHTHNTHNMCAGVHTHAHAQSTWEKTHRRLVCNLLPSHLSCLKGVRIGRALRENCLRHVHLGGLADLCCQSASRPERE